MNSAFHLINDDDISSFDIGTPAFLTNSCSTPTRESLCTSNQDGPEFTIVFIEPTISTYPIDPDTRQRLSDQPDKLFVESHYLSITSELVTPQLLKWERKKREKKEREKEKENANHIHIPSATEVKPKKQSNEARLNPQPLTVSIPEKKRKIRTIKNVKLVPVRLKSGEEVKATQDLIIHLRQKVAGSSDNPGKVSKGDGIDVFKIQSDTLPKVIHVPFTDQLSQALKRISSPKLICESGGGGSPLKRLNGHSMKNGMVTKPLKLRAALDKSTIAWSSTTKTRPKASLLDQLKSLTPDRSGHNENLSKIKTKIPPECKVTPPQTPPSLVPVLMKLTSKSQSTKLLPLSYALKSIASDTLNLDEQAITKSKMTNGDHVFTPT